LDAGFHQGLNASEKLAPPTQWSDALSYFVSAIYEDSQMVTQKQKKHMLDKYVMHFSHHHARFNINVAVAKAL